MAKGKGLLSQSQAKSLVGPEDPNCEFPTERR